MSNSKLWGSLREPRVRSMIGIVFLLVLFSFYLFFVAANLTTTFDDAYMFLRYAGNVLNGYGIAWNPDSVQTYGATSLLYLALVTFGRAVFSFADGSAMLVITSALLGLISLVLMWFGCLRLVKADFFKNYPLAFPLFLAVVFFLSPTFLLHATSGMDTTLALLCNTLLIFAALTWVRKNDLASLAWLILAAYASFLARPDNLIYAVLFPVLYGFFFFREQRMKMIAQFLISLLLLIVIDTAIKFLVFGDPLPLPFYAKTVGYDAGYTGAARWNPVNYLFDFFQLVLPFLLFFIFSLSKQTRFLSAAFFVPVTVTFAYYFSLTQIMGFGARYYFPSLPFFVIGIFLMLDIFLQQRSFAVLVRQPVRVGIAVGTVVFFLLSPIENSLAALYEKYFIPVPVVYESKMAQGMRSNLPELGWWQTINAMAEVASQLPAGTRVAMSEYGLIGADAPQILVIDMLGLHDPFFAHNGFSAAEFFTREPDLIWFPYPDYTRIVSSIQDDPRLWNEYEYYPGAFDYGIAIRIHSEYYEDIHRVLEKVWKDIYPDFDIENALAVKP